MPALAPSAVGAELLDDPSADPRAVAESLHHIARDVTHRPTFDGTGAP